MKLENWKPKSFISKIEIPLGFKCIMCGKSYRTQEELSEHQHYNCTGGW
jgi:hypothetical protein